MKILVYILLWKGNYKGLSVIINCDHKLDDINFDSFFKQMKENKIKISEVNTILKTDTDNKIIEVDSKLNF